MELIQINSSMNILQDMYTAQSALIKEYQRIEGLPEYPLDLDERYSQKLIKDFIYRFSEEFAEAFESLALALNCISTNDIAGAQKHMGQYQEEICDSWHFFLEILIFSGIEYEDLYELINSQFEKTQIGKLDTEPNLIHSLFKMAGAINFINREHLQIRGSAFNIPNPKDRILPYPGNKVSSEIEERHALFMFSIEHDLKKAANQLKNRDWTQTTREVNYQLYIQRLIEAFSSFFQYLHWAGFSSLTLMDLFNQTLLKNINRINKNY